MSIPTCVRDESSSAAETGDLAFRRGFLFPVISSGVEKSLIVYSNKRDVSTSVDMTKGGQARRLGRQGI